MDEYPLQNRLQPPCYQMMDDTITKMTGKYLTLDGVAHNKSGARLELICPTLYLSPELYALGFIVELEFESTIRISLVLATIIVRFEDV
jgi:hypothetical protein